MAAGIARPGDVVGQRAAEGVHEIRKTHDASNRDAHEQWQSNLAPHQRCHLPTIPASRSFLAESWHSRLSILFEEVAADGIAIPIPEKHPEEPFRPARWRRMDRLMLTGSRTRLQRRFVAARESM